MKDNDGKVNTEDKLEFWRLVVEEFENSEKSIKRAPKMI